MSWADSVGERTARATRPTYVPPHLRSSSNDNKKHHNGPFEMPRSSEPTTESGSYSPRLSRSGYRDPGRAGPGRGRGRGRGPGRGRGRGRGPGRGRGLGRSSSRRRREHDGGPTPVSELSDVEKFDELEVVECEVNQKNFDAYDDVPVETSGSNVPKPMNSFAEIDLGKALEDNIKRCKYVKPSPVQRHAIPVALAGRDLMACAQTGSGKTAAFCFPIISGILKNYHSWSRPVRSRGSRLAYPLALILSPTRELSCQIHEETKKFSYQTGLKVVVAYGGAPMSQQLRNLEKGVDILVATPGRLVDMIERARVSLEMVKYLALDEADRMLDMGFEPQIRRIVEQMEMPPPGARQTMLFSATLPTEIQRLASDFLSDYVFLAVGKVGSSTDLIVQRVEFVRDMEKRNYLMDLLKTHSSNGTHGNHALTLVFVETKRGADALEHWLSMNGFPATAIHGDKVQMERERALKSFKSGATPVLVATDVAARGLDIPNVAHVINFDLPRDIDDYVHRIGRTGRAGKSGLATALFSDKNLPLSKALVELMQEANQEVPSWLSQCAETLSFGNGGRAHRFSRSSKFSGRDFRNGTHCRGEDYSYSIPQADAVVADSSCNAASNYSASDVEVRADSFGYGNVLASGWE